MSVESMAIALHHSRATGVARLVLLGIANHDGDGGAWPSLDTLSVYAGGVSVRSVRRALSELKQLGEISREVNAGHGYRPDRRPNLYRFLLTCPQECDRTSRHRVRGIGAGRDGRTPMSARPDATTGPVDSDPVDNLNGGTQASPRWVERADAGVRHGRTQLSAKPSVEPSLVVVGTQGEVTSARQAVDVAVDGDEVTYFRAAVAHRPEPGGPAQAASGLSGLCPTHSGSGDAPPCRDCRDLRLGSEEGAARSRRPATVQASIRDQRQLQWNLSHASHPLLVSCGGCDENGYQHRSGRPCGHGSSCGPGRGGMVGQQRPVSSAVGRSAG